MSCLPAVFLITLQRQMRGVLRNLQKYIAKMAKKINCKTAKGKVCEIVKGRVRCKKKKLKVCVEK